MAGYVLTSAAGFFRALCWPHGTSPHHGYSSDEVMAQEKGLLNMTLLSLSYFSQTPCALISSAAAQLGLNYAITCYFLQVGNKNADWITRQIIS